MRGNTLIGVWSPEDDVWSPEVGALVLRVGGETRGSMPLPHSARTISTPLSSASWRPTTPRGGALLPLGSAATDLRRGCLDRHRPSAMPRASRGGQSRTPTSRSTPNPHQAHALCRANVDVRCRSPERPEREPPAPPRRSDQASQSKATLSQPRWSLTSRTCNAVGGASGKWSGM